LTSFVHVCCLIYVTDTHHDANPVVCLFLC